VKEWLQSLTLEQLLALYIVFWIVVVWAYIAWRGVRDARRSPMATRRRDARRGAMATRRLGSLPAPSPSCQRNGTQAVPR